jgi:hypothetical protein
MDGGKCEQGFRRMAARNKPAGIRSLVYGIGKGKVRIEGLSVSGQLQAHQLGLGVKIWHESPHLFKTAYGADSPI